VNVSVVFTVSTIASVTLLDLVVTLSNFMLVFNDLMLKLTGFLACRL